jgi:hypothetical protein
VLLLDELKNLIPPDIFTLSTSKRVLSHTPCGSSQTPPSVEFSRLYAHLQQQSFNASLSFMIKTFPWLAPSWQGSSNPISLLGEREQKLNYLSLRQRTACGRLNCTPCRNPHSDRETIETHFFFHSDFKLNHEITYMAIKQMHNRKTNTHEHIININTQRIDTKPWI